MMPQRSYDKKSAWEAGRDCALHGANTTNCHFSLFARPELARAWEEGKKTAEQKPDARNPYEQE